MFTNFNANLAYSMYGVKTEEELRKKIYATRSSITVEESDHLIELISKFDNPIYAEIGVYFGGTFAKILSSLKETKKDYYAYGFDLFEDLAQETFGENQTHDLVNKWNILNVAYRDDLDKTLREMGYEKFNLVKGSSDATVSSLESFLDVSLIDGNHTYEQAKLDFEAVFSKCRTGSYIVFDNSSNNIEPDPRYVKLDGGPWKLCQELKQDSRVRFVSLIHRCSTFKVV